MTVPTHVAFSVLGSICYQFSRSGWLLTPQKNKFLDSTQTKWRLWQLRYFIWHWWKYEGKWQWIIRVCVLKDLLQIAKSRMNTFGTVRCETFTSVIECQLCWNAYLIHFRWFISFHMHTEGISWNISTDSVWQLKWVTQYRIYQMLTFSWACTLKALLMCISCYIKFSDTRAIIHINNWIENSSKHWNSEWTLKPCP